MLLERIQQLCALSGIPGREDAVRDVIIDLIAPYADDFHVDGMGNIIAFKRGLDSTKKCLFAAHMDEVGLIVTGIAADGKLHVDAVGGIEPTVMTGKRVHVGDNGILGVIVSGGELTWDAMQVDIGASDAADAAKKIAIGDPIVFDSQEVLYGDGWFKAKALDDRLGCAVQTLLIQQVPAVDTYVVFTTQEEMGLRGALAATNNLNVDYAYVLESTTAADLVGVPKHKTICRPGHGVVLPFMDRGTIYSPALLKKVQAIADANGIPHQTKEYLAGGTDAAAITRSGEGVPVVALSAPTRSLHSPISAVQLRDVVAMFRLAYLVYKTAV